MKITFVGYAPSKSGDPYRPLDGPGTGYRLAKLLGLPHDEYLARFGRVNLFFTKPEKIGARDAKLSNALSFRSEVFVRYLFLNDERYVLLGRDVAKAFGICEMFSWVFIGSTRVAAIPHPSGRNRWYNDKKNVRRVERFLRALV